MSYKTNWFSKRDLRRLCRSIANLRGIEITADTLCDQLNGEIVSGGYGANVMEKLVREGVSREDAEMLLADLSEDGGYRTTEQAAEELGISEQRIKQLCCEGRMGVRVGRDWVITAEDIERNRERPGPGRPSPWASLDLDGIDHLTLTKRGAEVLAERIPVRDLADELKAGQTISYRTFAYEGGQTGHILIIHSDRQGRVDRAGIFFGGHSSWGDWDEATQTVRLDEADEDGLTVVYRTDGRRVVEE